MKHHVFTALILGAAALVYAVGFVGPSWVLVGCGATLELWFWVRVLRKR